MNSCPGDLKINFGTWFTPNDKIPGEITFCEYCVNNDCVKRSSVCPLQEIITNCNCDCSNDKLHKNMELFLCPICRIKEIGIKKLYLHGHCFRCQKTTPFHDQTYCSSCSILLDKCYQCGQTIKDDNQYLTEIELIVQQKINAHQQSDIHNLEYNRKIIHILRDELKKLKQQYGQNSSN